MRLGDEETLYWAWVLASSKRAKLVHIGQCEWSGGNRERLFPQNKGRLSVTKRLLESNGGAIPGVVVSKNKSADAVLWRGGGEGRLIWR